MAEQPSDKCDSNNGVNFESTAPPADGTDPLPGQSALTGQPIRYPPTNPNMLSSQPMFCVCPHCGHQGQSITTKRRGLGNHFCAGVSLFFGCWFGCCLIPYLITDLHDTIHECENCKNVIGINKFFD